MKENERVSGRDKGSLSKRGYQHSPPVRDLPKYKASDRSMRRKQDMKSQRRADSASSSSLSSLSHSLTPKEKKQKSTLRLRSKSVKKNPHKTTITANTSIHHTH